MLFDIIQPNSRGGLVNCSIWLYEWSEQKITIYYDDLAYRNSFENRHNPAPDPLGTVENPVVFDLKISYKVKY
jgi:hypothetical protein